MNTTSSLKVSSHSDDRSTLVTFADPDRSWLETFFQAVSTTTQLYDLLTTVGRATPRSTTGYISAKRLLRPYTQTRISSCCLSCLGRSYPGICFLRMWEIRCLSIPGLTTRYVQILAQSFKSAPNVEKCERSWQMYLTLLSFLLPL